MNELPKLAYSNIVIDQRCADPCISGYAVTVDGRKYIMRPTTIPNQTTIEEFLKLLTAEEVHLPED